MSAASSASLDLREGLPAMDLPRVREWLANSYWTPGIAQETIEHACRHSALVIGAFDAAGRQTGFMRVVSDCARFAYLCDVIVAPEQRGLGIARQMVQHVLDHPALATVRTWTLATRDAHGVYAPLGFKPMSDPESRPQTWMVLRRGQGWDIEPVTNATADATATDSTTTDATSAAAAAAAAAIESEAASA